jgi:hypothetical protein
MHPGPPEDPYSSLESVQHLDRALDNLHAVRKESASAFVSLTGYPHSKLPHWN